MAEPPAPRLSSPKDRLPAARPVVIGLLGGVASGKSTVAALFGELGWAVADADGICHELLEAPAVRERVVARFGRGVLGPAGGIDRAALSRVFASRAELADLEAILHPLVRERALAAVAAARSAGAPGVVLDAPLLLESGLDALCDALVMVVVSARTRRRRAGERGLAPEDWARREGCQLSVRTKRRRADHTLDGEAPVAGLRRAVARLARRLLATPPGRPGAARCGEDFP
ncbi:MAG: dephospho-CoA kinase [Planctomycetes bacterium]|nr:dephospho-CoA kinase [Planctomycetota bacterium]